MQLQQVHKQASPDGKTCSKDLVLVGVRSKTSFWLAFVLHLGFVHATKPSFFVQKASRACHTQCTDMWTAFLLQHTLSARLELMRGHLSDLLSVCAVQRCQHSS